ncbi:mucin-2 isoform X2 [Tetranychus urticae]|uniref:mucin-2 isoform X2 n=1 Tax=Tetranychus urticae TaxID=32264 RepID=UPI00077BF5EB|nr:mucin-2 isoform X2 [Tetranychus urticae]
MYLQHPGFVFLVTKSRDTSTSSPKATGIKSILDPSTWKKTSTATVNPPYAPLPPPPPANSPSTPINVSTPTIAVSLPSVYSSNPPPPQTSITYLSSPGTYPSSHDWRLSNQYPSRSPPAETINNQPIDLAIACRFASIYRPSSTGLYSSPTSPLPSHLSLHPPSTYSHYPTSHLSSPTIPSSSSPSSTGSPHSYVGYRYFGYPCVIPSTILPEHLPNLLPYQQVPLASDATPVWSLPPLISPLTPLSLFPVVNKMDDDSPQKSWTHESSDSENSPSDHPSQSSHHSSHMHRSARAVAELSGPSGVTGTVVFTQIGHHPVSMEGKVMGLAPGPHGLHIYELPFIAGDCTTAGDHYNPKKTEHGGKNDWNRHIGDLGNIYVYSDGVAFFEEMDLQISLHGGHSIVNRTLGISEKADDLGRGNDFQSKKDGNAGTPIACGIIHLRPI